LVLSFRYDLTYEVAIVHGDGFWGKLEICKELGHYDLYDQCYGSKFMFSHVFQWQKHMSIIQRLVMTRCFLVFQMMVMGKMFHHIELI